MSRMIVSCCYADNRKEYYAQFADRLEQSLNQFGNGVSRHIWRDSWPPGSPSHSQHHYAFKWFAMEYARAAGYRYVMWLDAGSCAIANIEPLWQYIERDGYVLLKGADCLGHWIGDHALEHFGVTREHALTLKLMGGCLVGLDFENEKARKFFDWWGQLAKTTNLFMCSVTADAKINGVLRSVQALDSSGRNVISTDPRVKGHRSDEACFSLMLDKLGMEGITLTDWRKVMVTY